MIDTETYELLINSLNFRKPILFLGAGFSSNAINSGSSVPIAMDLKAKLYNYFYEINCPKNVTEKDKQEIKAFPLAELCKAIQNDGRNAELTEFLVTIFKGCNADPNDPYHNLLCDYYWDKIYTLNIDDLVENVFKNNRKTIVVQNEKVRKLFNNQQQLIKLHGCVNNPTDGFIFSSDEYASNIAKEDYRLKEFSQDYFANDVIFLGTEFNESDVQVILEKNRQSGFTSNNCNYFFISPSIGYKLKSLITVTPNFHYIDWDTKKFLQECGSLNKRNKDIDIQERLLEQQGNFLKVRNYKDVPEEYESKLYYGNKVNFYDIFSNWDIENTKTERVCQKIIREGQSGGYAIAIYGKAFSGKTVVATRLLVELYKHGYESFSYNCDGEEELNQLFEYFNKCTSLKKVAILIDDAAYLYGSISKLISNVPNHIKSAIFILVSEEKKHNSQKHELICVNGREWKVNDQFDDKLPARVYRKLDEKHRLGSLTRYTNEGEAIAKIAESKFLTEFLYQLTHGQGFKDYFKKLLNDFLSNSNRENAELLKTMCIFSKLGIHNVNQGLLLLICPTIQKERFDDLIWGITTSGSVTLRCSEAYDEFLFSIPSSERLEIVYKTLTSIANMFREEENNRWKNVFEQLLKSKSLFHDLKLDQKDMAALFAKLERYYSNVSYFWLQRGLFKQSIGEYDESDNFLNQALAIRPNSYQIRHAIAKNKLEHSIAIVSRKHELEAFSLYENGIRELVSLIESPRFSRNIGHSVHSYIITTIKYFRKASKKISEAQILEMYEYLVQSSKQSYDQWMNTCRKDLFFYCQENAPKLTYLFEVKEFDKYNATNYIRKI